MAIDPEELAQRIRALPVFAGDHAFDAGAAPADPVALFASWIGEAIAAGVPEPHAMSLATADAEGWPNARVLITKGVTADGAWRFAGDRTTAKGVELAATEGAAATFYWPALGRQVRLRGPVREAGAEASLADLMGRSASARATTSAEAWTLWELVADEVEFFQGRPDRHHVRLAYRRTADGWGRRIL